ncbi:3' terminal RNA ribose 2'-O-methyltransferase Hen1 [Aetokthonos hydrillicola Thurmond2011]|jgi:3' terminal RNA ribose 2'-O-methyltransferase Hen1|uniref:Small RNA 2'-O-methyltransferase n=1 Tax=Aetokthonos hydrillicola Thurmond2011 TaxID=2712845 RepID=A0AAP5I671_9CYAN|nr:3' terminal RNA ribose 2'-O-methyltransferase Hen1 [Aetokthonos hydrillicola]MBW4589926.1 3' terminal RNA ribose 2'-O-methyltransferase Hen1 [Aetokthonos hydrillicola CCALA 1050]MDR9895747.1 3' terminal RNA ribose 2'-O-methyltransferase Hen1 [Aetokthonos hydrillicola Thurmond2011]
MLVTITTTYYPATDLGYLLHKHPDRCQSFPLSFGTAHVFYPEVSEQRCTAALLLDVDPVRLVRGRSVTLEQYVNDRPYVASSFLSVAIAQVFSTALAGRCKDRPELAQTPIPLSAYFSVLPCRGGERFLRQLFEPLGYTVTAQRHSLDEQFPDWGPSQYYTVQLHNTILLADLLSHLYVLISVLDDDKHYWVGDEEVEKLLRHGEGWLSKHPAREQIANRYLKRQRHLTRTALKQLLEEDQLDPETAEETHPQEEAAVEKLISLNQQRLNAVVTALKQIGARRVIDLGCGQGNLLLTLLKDNFFTEITGVDVSYSALEVAQERLERLRLSPEQYQRIQLIQGALTYQDKRLKGYDAATIIEVIEHLDQSRLASFERVVFQFTQPKTVIVTTPNIEYNVKFENLPTGKLRHKDHRFEWTRLEFQNWANRVAERFNYTVKIQPIGEDDLEVGSPTQMGVFQRE